MRLDAGTTSLIGASMHALLLFAVLSADEYPPPALAKITEAVQQAETARKIYYAKLEEIRGKLLTDLQKQLEALTKKGDFDGATRLKKDIERLKSDDFISFM